MEFFLWSIISSLLTILLVISWMNSAAFRKRYRPIIDVDNERIKIQETIKGLLKKKETLIAEYDNAHKVYVKLKEEIGLLEESVDMTEMGIYKPHFDFGASENYRHKLEELNEKEKELIKADRAVRCDTEWTVSGSKSEGRKMTRQINKLMLRAFNGECDAALAKVRWDNILKMEERIRKAFEVINKCGEVNKSCITDEYYDLKIQEIRLTHEYQEKIKQEKDEQRQIQEDMREEERAQREIERAKEDAEKEEKRYQKALEKAREDVLHARGDEINKLKEEIGHLEGQLKTAQELKERALSRAQITKSGHVYIISNIGSFGERVYKIGMTRRLDPLDRVKELSDASVPFPFDIHGLIYSDNAPELEDKLHREFENKRINLVNERKEFFEIALDEISEWATRENIKFQITKIAEAREFRETQAVRQKKTLKVEQELSQEKLPNSVDKLFNNADGEGN